MNDQQKVNWGQAILNWLGRQANPGPGIKRNLVLLTGVAALSLLPLDLAPGPARFWAPALAAIILIAALLTLGSSAWLSSHLEVLRQGKQFVLLGRAINLRLPAVPGGSDKPLFWIWQTLTRFGLLFPALVFFLFWTLLYITAWAYDPGTCPADPAQACSSAFAGLPASPTFGDFLYFAVNMAFANPVPDILARSRLTHTMVTLEVISGIALATLYASTFFGLGRQR